MKGGHETLAVSQDLSYIFVSVFSVIITFQHSLSHETCSGQKWGTKTKYLQHKFICAVYVYITTFSNGSNSVFCVTPEIKLQYAVSSRNYLRHWNLINRGSSFVMCWMTDAPLVRSLCAGRPMHRKFIRYVLDDRCTVSSFVICWAIDAPLVHSLCAGRPMHRKLIRYVLDDRCAVSSFVMCWTIDAPLVH
jgi:hypothetical protein